MKSQVTEQLYLFHRINYHYLNCTGMSLKFAKILNLFQICSLRDSDVRNIRWEQERGVENIRHKKRIKRIFRIENKVYVGKAKKSQVLKGKRFCEYHLHSLNILNCEYWIELNFFHERKLLALFKNWVQVCKNKHLIVRFNLIILALTFLANLILWFLHIYSRKF